jgi:two-component system, sensor histidine kinase
LLKSWGHRVIAARSGDEAVERLSTSSVRPDLLICDYRLRGEESGIAVIERLRSEYNEAIPAVLITGDTAPGRLAEAEASGLLLLHKPVPNGKLRAAIANLTRSAGRRRDQFCYRDRGRRRLGRRWISSGRRRLRRVGDSDNHDLDRLRHGGG